MRVNPMPTSCVTRPVTPAIEDLLVTEDLFGSQWPVAQLPGKSAVRQFAGQLRRWDGQDRAPGMS
jgi:hypothetical protein